MALVAREDDIHGSRDGALWASREEAVRDADPPGYRRTGVDAEEAYWPDNQLSLVGSGRRCTARRSTVETHVSLESGGLESLACPFMAGHVLRAVGHVLRAASSRLLASCV